MVDIAEKNLSRLEALDPIIFMKRFGAEIASIIYPTKTPETMKVKVLKKSNRSLTLKVSVFVTDKVVKYFGSDDDVNEGIYLRERDALLLLGGTGLSPELHAFCDKNRYLIMEHLDGFDLRELIEPSMINALSRDLGQWLGQFARRSPSQPATGNWFEYLSNYPSLTASPVLSSAKSELGDFHFDRIVLSKNDGALANFFVKKDGKILGLDFENTEFKPIGWDLLLVSRALVRLYPDKSEIITRELAKGFCDTAPGRQEQYTSLIRIFVISAAFEPNADFVMTPPHEALRHFNESAEFRADLVASCQFKASTLIPQNPETLQTFWAHVENLASKAKGMPTAKADDTKKFEFQPQLELQALCSACQGSCCGMAVGQNAFIDLDTIIAFKVNNPDFENRDIAEAYAAYVPSNHVEDSCFYHTSSGCALPREMRSATCNNYKCGGAKALLSQIKLRTPKSVLCVAGSGRDFRSATQTINGRIERIDPRQVTKVFGLPERKIEPNLRNGKD
jgi:hypothetical protein